MPSLHLLGRDHQSYGVTTAVALGARAAAAISVGADPDSPSLVFKDDPNVLNEDALCVSIDGTRTGIAVADAHYGPESSHSLIAALHERWGDDVPATREALAAMVASLGHVPATDSETALLVAVHEATTGNGFGLSVGDATLVVVGQHGISQAINPRNHRYLSAAGAGARPKAFGFRAQPGDLLLAFTDGVDECHYRNPDTSIRPHHIEQLVADVGRVPLTVVSELAELALRGVDGHPGGQDNVAIVAVTATATAEGTT